MAQVEIQKPERLPRGSNPPFIGVGDAFELVQKIYEQGGGQASRDLMSRLTGNSYSSSSFIKKIGALKSYGLVTYQNEAVFLSEIGTAIAAPTSEMSEANAKKTAFLNIGVFSKIYDRHKGKLLPADEFLRNIVEQDAGIPRELSSEWVLAFKSSARAAGLFYDRPDGKTQIVETPAETARKSETVAETVNSPSSQFSSNGSPPIGSVAVPFSASGNNARFELSDGRVAEFSIPFGITSRDAKRLKSYLEGLKLIIDAAIDDVGETNT